MYIYAYVSAYACEKSKRQTHGDESQVIQKEYAIQFHKQIQPAHTPSDTGGPTGHLLTEGYSPEKSYVEFSGLSSVTFFEEYTI